MEQKITNSIWKESLTPSIIFALVSIIISLVVYFFDLATKSLFAGIYILLFSLIINFVLLLLLTKKYRDDILGGFISYGKALLFCLVIGIYSSIFVAAYNYTFSTVIDSEYQKHTNEKVQVLTANYMLEKGTPETQVNEIVDKMKKKALPSPIKASLLSIPGTIIFTFLISLITSAIVKREEEIFE